MSKKMLTFVNNISQKPISKSKGAYMDNRIIYYTDDGKTYDGICHRHL